MRPAVQPGLRRRVRGALPPAPDAADRAAGRTAAGGPWSKTPAAPRPPRCLASSTPGPGGRAAAEHPGAPARVAHGRLRRPRLLLEEADAAFADPDAIGWAYQFYQEEAKARTYASWGAAARPRPRAEIASVTQLFTEPYMVQWLLQNSLGRTYHELYPDSTCRRRGSTTSALPDDVSRPRTTSSRSIRSLAV